MAQGKYLSHEGLAYLLSKLKKNLSSEITNAIEDAKVFHVTITGNAESGYTSNKTFAEINEAYKSGKPVYCNLIIDGLPFVLPPLAIIEVMESALFGGYAGNEGIIVMYTPDGITVSSAVMVTEDNFLSHTNNTSNPHNVTYKQAGAAPEDHEHTIEDVSELQTALNSKAASSHGTHVSYASTNPLMDGTASSGSAATVSRSDHKHPTDTTRASASDLSAHIGNSDVHFTATERIKLSGIDAGAQVNTITGVKGGAESAYRTGNINITASNIGLGNVNNTSDMSKPVSTAQQAAISAALADAQKYTDGKIDTLVGEGASEALDTIGEIASAIEANQDILDVLQETKAFSKIAVGNSTIEADALADTLTLAGSNVTITPDATNDKITIGITKNNVISALGYTPPETDTSYTHPTYTARTGVPSANQTPGFGGTFTVSQPISDGTGHITAINSRTITIPSATATATTAGLMSAADKVALNEMSKHSHTISYTPSGTVGGKSITPAGNVTSSFTGTASEHGHSFSGSEATISAVYTPSGSVSSTFTGTAKTSDEPSATTTVASSTHTHKYTPAGTVSQPTFTGVVATSEEASDTTTVYSITDTGTLPSHSYTAPSLSASVTGRCLTLTFSAGSHSFNAGTLPTKSSGVSVSTGSHTHSVTAKGTVSKPTFTGTEASTTFISGTTTVGSNTHTHSVTPTGTITNIFAGEEATISASYTPAGNITTASITPAGSVSSTFKGTAVSHDHTFAGETTELITD